MGKHGTRHCFQSRPSSLNSVLSLVCHHTNPCTPPIPFILFMFNIFFCPKHSHILAHDHSFIKKFVLPFLVATKHITTTMGQCCTSTYKLSIGNCYVQTIGTFGENLLLPSNQLNAHNQATPSCQSNMSTSFPPLYRSNQRATNLIA